MAVPRENELRRALSLPLIILYGVGTTVGDLTTEGAPVVLTGVIGLTVRQACVELAADLTELLGALCGGAALLKVGDAGFKRFTLGVTERERRRAGL